MYLEYGGVSEMKEIARHVTRLWRSTLADCINRCNISVKQEEQSIFSSHHSPPLYLTSRFYLTIKSLTDDYRTTMSLSTVREPSVVLIDYTTYTPWMHQLQTRCVSLDVWELIDPAKTTLTKTKPSIPTEPNITAYEPKASLGIDDDGTIAVPSAPSELPCTSQGLEGEHGVFQAST